jgi:hypothetical protein
VSQRASRRRKAEGKKNSTTTTAQRNHTEAKPQGPDLSGSDLDPSKYTIQRSIKLVEAWLEECERAVMLESENAGTGSMVSLLGVGLVDRPALDVAVYRPMTGKGEGSSTKMSKNLMLKSKSGSSRSRCAFRRRKVRDCVYDRPSQVLNHESMEGLESGRRGQILERLQRLLKRKKVKGGSELLREYHNGEGGNEERGFFMSGGRSHGGSEAIRPKRRRNEQISKSERDVSRCLCGGKCDPHPTQRGSSEQPLCGAGSASRGPIHDSIFPEGEHSPLSECVNGRRLSGDDLTLGVDALPKSQDNNSNFDSSSSASTMSSPPRSRASSFNIGSIIERPISPRELEDRERLESEIDRPPSPFPFVPSPPRPMQAFRSHTFPLRRKPFLEKLRPVAPEPVENTFASISRQPSAFQRKLSPPTREPGGFVREQMAMPGVVGQGIQAFVAKRERRRADGMSGGTGTGTEIARSFGQILTVEEATAAFARNRERRRAERYSAGRIEEVQDGEMTSGTGQKVAGSGGEKKGFNVDDGPVASGAAWERRIKKGQSPAKRTPAEKYREEERAKYWSPK